MLVIVETAPPLTSSMPQRLSSFALYGYKKPENFRPTSCCHEIPLTLNTN